MMLGESGNNILGIDETLCDNLVLRSKIFKESSLLQKATLEAKELRTLCLNSGNISPVTLSQVLASMRMFQDDVLLGNIVS